MLVRETESKIAFFDSVKEIQGKNPLAWVIAYIETYKEGDF